MTEEFDILDELEEDEEILRLDVGEELQRLRREAEELRIPDFENKSQEELERQIPIYRRVIAEGLKRLQFQEGPGRKALVEDDPTNIEILAQEATEGDLSRIQVIDKLKGYRLLVNKDNTTNRRWIRFINIEQGKLRTGGFPIKNEGEFIVLKNVSKKITLSIKKDNVIIFEKVPAGILPPNIQELFNNLSNTGNNYVIISPDLQFIFTGRTMTQVARNANMNRNSVSRAFGANRRMIKKHYLFRMTNEELENVRTLLEDVDLGDNIDPQVMEIINRYYPV